MTLKLSYLRLIFLTKRLRKRWRGKNNIKSAHFPSKYGKCADFMLLALCFKFNMVLWRIAKRRTLFDYFKSQLLHILRTHFGTALSIHACGKSLLVSTCKSYFQGKKELFKGLAIEKLEKDWTEYPVLHFSMAGGKHMNSILPILYQSGCITIKDYDPETKLFTLDIPNKEAQKALTW